jgi:amidophosphoribosyltransferase
MCGIVGIFGRAPVGHAIYDALLVLQHRGQDAAGIVTQDERGILHLRKKNGLATDVFQQRHMLRLQGNLGIGHVRYPTAGSSSNAEAQPFYVNSPYGIALAHNGNLTNADQLKEDLFREDLRHINTTSDSEVLLNIFAHELHAQGSGSPRMGAEDVFDAVRGVHRRCRGGYAVVAMIAGYGLLGFRDPHGIRPVVFGKRESPQGDEYMIASESVALDVLGFKLVRDIAPGEAIFVDMQGRLHTTQCADKPVLTPCIFEFVYFARPDSIIDSIFVHKARSRMGVALAEKIRRVWPGHDIDVVIPIPDTSRTAALELANVLGLKYAEGFIKNRYIGRTFIMPGQQLRAQSVRRKLNAITSEFAGKNVLLVDDSIVRGTTSKKIVEMAREAGAKRVYLASASPPVRYPNVYGIDMPAASELVAHGRSEEEVRQIIGADRLFYQDLPDLIEATRKKGRTQVQRFDTSVFDGTYVTGDVTADYLDSLERQRSDRAKQERDGAQRPSIVDLCNTT